MTPTERWHRHANVGGPADCWAWSGTVSRTRYGVPYGRMTANGRGIPAHRFAYEMFRGRIPEGLTIDHLCRNPLCQNPWHMEPVTRAENTRRRPSDHCGLFMASKTHCPSGHPYSPENTYHGREKGKRHRRCRICWNASKRRLYHRRRAEGWSKPWVPKKRRESDQ